MYKLKKKYLDKYLFVKNFISGIKLEGKDIKFFLENKINLKFCIIKLDNNNIIFIFNNKKRFLLLKKKEINFILNFLNYKKYNCIPIKILKINSFFKIKISIVKKKG
ncbi:SsrA-binding protein [Candidatus Carsonella ruddii]|uniref:SsrA-binding protein n=1 Tax=Carsonella ruddii TaxID=114186 RepID=A0AAJ6FH17_CARRU|nr:SsrA-binding protein [Candidatus Carsonella ruddii]WGS66742.1 SsrA-binding protein [Candidatus Carsonella ruddii]WGS66936.1 SsrA-binding protein [Candidatus Carsonella ruddii]WGS67128.1 SsrA-binding protein [Candidatus Carsonella ruddii]WGS67320.1 SsrA-binding protein [Candidatus Carsonella ruddii]WMC18338.1 MAG: SsrA-binding protein [Candidatus Carsonella ruddii]